jgi:hypothetical protein
MLRVGTERPRGIDFEFVDAGGFHLFLDRTLPRPERIEVTVGRWPRRRLCAAGFGEGAFDGGEGTESAIWDSLAGGGDGGAGGGNGS